MILTLAFRNLFHDRIRLAVTLVGILFSIVLVAVQLGLYLGASNMITANIDAAKADLWITVFGAKSFEDGGMLLTSRERHQALATPGVKAVIPLIVRFAEWRKPEGGSTRVVIVGTDAEDGGLAPINLVDGTWEDIKAPEAVAVDRTYFNELGIKGIGDTAQVIRTAASACAPSPTASARSCSRPTPTRRSTALAASSAIATASRSTSCRRSPAPTSRRCARICKGRLEGAEVLTQAEFRDRSLKQWLFRTGAGVALIGGALLGSLVGTVIVAQTLYSSTKDHLGEFATLRALGSSSGYIHQVILAQAGISAVVGYALGISIALTILVLSRNTALPMVMTPGLAFWLFALTVGMCAISALSAIVKVTKIDPATVFNK